MRSVAVVVPGYNRADFTEDEEMSFRHVEHYLGRYDKFLVVPQSLAIERPGFHIQRFPDSYFGSAIANARLMLSPTFYEAFKAYRYVLIYQLDALVFSDRLLEWCARDWDYVGAPWLPCADSPWVGTSRVGNGGFSLRKVSSFLRVLSSDAYWVDPEVYWQRIASNRPWYVRSINLPRKWFKQIKRFNNVKRELERWHLRPDGTKNEDHFWADEAVRYDSRFKVAPFQVGLDFAFEVVPRHCFEMNQHRLPFGCHAWPRYDRSFWEPYLLKP
ncbi:MAG TPA: DUF5672 family protein [Nitrospira sp.]|nr:hypothetical protein [Nitrospira sp. NTP1]HQR16023.1 DUF5672 family protein [Nitrospira sp.]HQV11815.1 DUF5672 family protein [Nitrospira sp.]